ncbi:MAG: hypothetical protein ABIO83_07380 [Ilumatobacteraceae bacterium]
MPATAPIERWVPWVLRAVWVAVLVLGGQAIDAVVTTAVEPSGVPVAAVVRFGGAAVWLLGVAAMAIPSVVGLTATRAVVPVAVPFSVVVWAAGAPAVDGALFVAVAALATVVASSGELGRAFVQASAYGDEDRHLLRPPAAYLLAVLVSWAIVAACGISAGALLAHRQWIVGGILGVAAVAAAVWSWPRWHRLSRRWFVVVPVGVVVHDQLVLGETLMLRRRELAALHLAPATTDAADLTGPAGGHAIEIVTSEPVDVIFAATPREPTGRTIHMTACLVGPTRPGRALASAGLRNLPVG